MEKYSVFFEVRPELLNIIYTSSNFIRPLNNYVPQTNVGSQLIFFYKWNTLFVVYITTLFLYQTIESSEKWVRPISER
jgi:hypothetical protein